MRVSLQARAVVVRVTVVLISLAASFCVAQARESIGNFSQWQAKVNALPRWMHQNLSVQEVAGIKKAFAYGSAYDTVSTVPELSWAEFKRVLDLFYASMGSGAMRSTHNWVNGPIDWVENVVLQDSAPPQADFFTPEYDVSQEPVIHQHYVQKVRIPAGSKVVFHGDLHGDVHSLVASVAPYLDKNNGFKIKDKNLYMVFLGDYVDRGLYGYESIYTLMRLKIDNPDQIFLSRGNHEDAPISNNYGFAQELNNKVKKAEFLQAKKAIYSMYSILPAAVFIGSGDDFLLCCHGGLELGFDARVLLNTKPELDRSFAWISVLNQKKLMAEVMGASCASCCGSACDNMTPIYNTGIGFFDLNALQTEKKEEAGFLGFLWNDFSVDPTRSLDYNPGRGWVLGKSTTVKYLQKFSEGKSNLRGIFRAHQHTPQATDSLMRLLLDLDGVNSANKGIAKLWQEGNKKADQLWDGIVVTFNLSPGSLYGFPDAVSQNTGVSWPGFDFDTVGELTTAPKFDNWKLMVKRTNTMQLPAYRQKWAQGEANTNWIAPATTTKTAGNSRQLAQKPNQAQELPWFGRLRDRIAALWGK
jgi:hypothetical protein